MQQTRLIDNYQYNNKTCLRMDIPPKYEKEGSNEKTVRYYLGLAQVDSTDFIKNDHDARIRGYMYAPFMYGGYINGLGTDKYFWSSDRFFDSFRKRIIVYKGYMEPKKDYYIKIKFVNNGSVYIKNVADSRAYYGCPFTFIELTPESVYNGNRHEDWW